MEARAGGSAIVLPVNQNDPLVSIRRSHQLMRVLVATMPENWKGKNREVRKEQIALQTESESAFEKIAKSGIR